MNVKIEGLDKLNALLKGMPGTVNNVIEKELKIVGLDLQGKAQALTPVDQGDLQGSAFTEVSGLEAVIGFEEIYAMYIHEGVGYRHPKGGEAKFLEKPYKENVPKYVDMIGNAIKKAVDK